MGQKHQRQNVWGLGCGFGDLGLRISDVNSLGSGLMGPKIGGVSEGPKPTRGSHSPLGVYPPAPMCNAPNVRNLSKPRARSLPSSGGVRVVNLGGWDLQEDCSRPLNLARKT